MYMIETGNAWWYRQYAKNEYEFKAVEKKAKDQKLGLWKESNPVAP
nr:thermonuclease family protein [Cetobacterium sp. 2A]